MLRTSFRNTDENPIQIFTDAQLTLQVRDEQERRIRHLAQEEAQTPFDLSQSPLLRATLLRLVDDEHVLLLTTHHIASDGWSMGVLMKETVALYEAFSKGLPSPLPELRVQYADFAVWQRQRLDGEALAAEIAYWREHLGGDLPVLDLPTDHLRPRLQSFTGAYETLVIDESLTEATKVLSRREGVTLFMTLLATFNVLLSRYTSQDDILIGTPVANRNEIDLEPLIGFFVNTLVLRTDLSGSPTVRELLARVRETALGAYMHQELPFEELIKSLQPERDLSRSPLFQVMFTYQNLTRGEVELPGLKVTPLRTESPTAKFDLTLLISETEEGLQATLEYNRDLFEPATARRLLERYERLLSSAVTTVGRCVAELELLSAAEREQLLVGWNQTAVNWEEDCSLPELFEIQVERTPAAVALSHEGGQLTYAQLNARANQLAHYLLQRGVGPEALVGVCLERSPEMVVALLAVLKAGAAYVPLDPGYPTARLNFMIEDAGLALVIGTRASVANIGDNVDHVVRLDEDAVTVASQSVGNLNRPIQPNHLAYVIYTSGSTGAPKGAMIPHAGIVNRLLWMQQAYQLTASDTVLQKTVFTFDVSVWEFFWPLLVGARLALAAPGGHRDSSYLVQTLRDEEVTTVHFVPSMLQAFLEAEGVEQCTSLRRVICSGEALSVELQQRFFSRLNAELHNLYGPTEASVDVTYWQCDSSDTRTSVPIGFPIANTQIHILDGMMQPAPVGIPGELFIGGVGLARGYLRRPDLTAEKFIPDPFATKPGQRLYRSGDQARRLPGGEIEFLGRRDHQVKLRGFRIELREIESVLTSHAAVKEAVVVLRDTRLVAYIVPSEKLNVKELRDHARTALPDYMVPSTFVELEKLPLTRNGKLDRAALPSPSELRSESTGVYVAPQNDVELQLAQIWEEVLSVRPIGIHDNFFELGGHSFVALRLMVQVRKCFGVQLPLVALFEGATIYQLARLLQKQTTQPPKSPLVAIQPSGTKPQFFCVHEITGSVLVYVNLARYLGLDQPFYGLQTPDFGEHRRPYQTLHEMAADYVDELRKVQPEGPYHLGGWSSGGLVAFEMAQQLTRDSHEVALLALLDTAAPSHNDAEEYDDASLLAGLARVHNLPISIEELRSVPADEQFRYAIEKANLGSTLDVEQLRWLLDTSRTNLRAGQHYHPQRYPNRITLFRSTEQRPDAEGEEQFKIYDDLALGWSEFSSEPIEVHHIPGSHFTLLTEPNVEVLAERLKDCLAKAGESVLTAGFAKK